MLNYFTKQVQRNALASRDLNTCSSHFLTLDVTTNQLKTCITHVKIWAVLGQKTCSLLDMQRVSKNPAFLLMTEKIPQMAQNKAENDDWSSQAPYRQSCSRFQTITADCHTWKLIYVLIKKSSLFELVSIDESLPSFR